MFAFHQRPLGPFDQAAGVKCCLELVGQGATELGLGRSQEQAGHDSGIGLGGNDFGVVPAPRVGRIQGADRAATQLDGDAQA